VRSAQVGRRRIVAAPKCSPPCQRAPEDAPGTQSATDDKSRYTWSRNDDNHSLGIHIIQPETLPKSESDARRATDGKSRYTNARWHGEFANRSCLSLHCATFFLREVFPDPRRTKPDPACATFPAAGDTVPLSCSQIARPRWGLTHLGLSEGCLSDQPLVITNVTIVMRFVHGQPFTLSSQAGKRSRNFTNQRQRWSRRASQNHKPFTPAGKVPSSIEPALRGDAVVSFDCLAALQACKNVVVC